MLFKIKSLKELEKFARGLANKLIGGEVVGLTGELGAGKTTLIQMIGKELGVKDTMQSPSFNIFKIYKTSHKKIKQLCHADLYRLEKTGERIGWEEYLSERSAVCLIEWADKIKTRLPKETIWLNIKVGAGGIRVIKKITELGNWSGTGE